MKFRIRGGAITLAVLAGVGVAAAQTVTSDTRLQLSQPQKEKIIRSISGGAGSRDRTGETPPPGVTVDLKVGAAMPKNIELLDLPSATLAEIPAIGRYKYAKFGDDIAIVDPISRQIVEILRQ
jgi:hypothetical protein